MVLNTWCRFFPPCYVYNATAFRITFADSGKRQWQTVTNSDRLLAVITDHWSSSKKLQEIQCGSGSGSEHVSFIHVCNITILVLVPLPLPFLSDGPANRCRNVCSPQQSATTVFSSRLCLNPIRRSKTSDRSKRHGPRPLGPSHPSLHQSVSQLFHCCSSCSCCHWASSSNCCLCHIFSFSCPGCSYCHCHIFHCCHCCSSCSLCHWATSSNCCLCHIFSFSCSGCSYCHCHIFHCCHSCRLHILFGGSSQGDAAQSGTPERANHYGMHRLCWSDGTTFRDKQKQKQCEICDVQV